MIGENGSRDTVAQGGRDEANVSFVGCSSFLFERDEAGWTGSAASIASAM